MDNIAMKNKKINGKFKKGKKKDRSKEEISDPIYEKTFNLAADCKIQYFFIVVNTF